MKHLIFFIYLICFIFLYSVFVEPNLIVTKKITIKDNDIKNLKIVFLSDFHLSKYANIRLNRIIDKVNKQDPDIIILGGDYVKSRGFCTMDSDKIAAGLSKLKSKYGIYAVLGNHDYYFNGEKIKKSLKNSGIKVLENENCKIDVNGKELYIAGISDMQTTKYSLKKALLNVKKPAILISHSPDIAASIENEVNLILSGHTHGGQVRIPIYGAVIVPSRYGKKYESGYIDKKIYVSKGLGTSILPVRFNCLPEISVINFIQ